MPRLPLTGHCLCGAVEFEVTEQPESAGYCHCTRCQRRSGTAASAQVRIVPGSHRITAGEELVRSYEPPDGAIKDFCSACGSALWSRERETREVTGIRMAAFEEDPGLRPQYRQYVAYAASWEALPEDGLPRFAERRPPEEDRAGEASPSR